MGLPRVPAPLIVRHAATLGIKRYVQVYGIEAAPTGGRPQGFDAIGETDTFLTDLSRSPRTFGTEIPIIG